MFQKLKEQQREQPPLRIGWGSGLGGAGVGAAKGAMGQGQGRLGAAAEQGGKAKQRLIIQLDQSVESQGHGRLHNWSRARCPRVPADRLGHLCVQTGGPWFGDPLREPIRPTCLIRLTCPAVSLGQHSQRREFTFLRRPQSLPRRTLPRAARRIARGVPQCRRDRHGRERFVRG